MVARSVLKERVPSNATVLGEGWEGDLPNCSLCKATLGSLQRHHCRICGRCICASCSPHSVKIETSCRQRACNHCVEPALKGPILQKRLALLGDQLTALHDPERAPSPPQTSVDACLAYCEGAIAEVQSSIKEKMLAEEARKTREQNNRHALQDDLDFAKDFILNMGLRLHSMHGSDEPASNDPESLQDIISYCAAALGPLQESMASASRSFTNRKASRSRTPNGQRTNGRSRSLALPESRMSLISVCSYETDAANNPRGAYLCQDCHVCNAKLGKRHLRPRHTCQVCQKPVCGPCSPSSLQLEKMGSLQRACTPCVMGIHTLTAVQGRLALFSERLTMLAAAGNVAGEECIRGGSVELILGRAETALGNLERASDLKHGMRWGLAINESEE